MRKSLPRTQPSAPSSRAASVPAFLAAAVHRRAAKASVRSGEAYGGSNGRRQHPGSELVHRLRLLEGFLSRTEFADCAHHALKWLGEVLRVPQSICLVRPKGEQILVTVGSYGLSRGTTA